MEGRRPCLPFEQALDLEGGRLAGIFGAMEGEQLFEAARPWAASTSGSWTAKALRP